MRVLLLISILMLGACTTRQATLPTAWLAQTASQSTPDYWCKDEAQKLDAAASGKADKGGKSQAIVDNFVSCMRERGYVQIKS